MKFIKWMLIPAVAAMTVSLPVWAVIPATGTGTGSGSGSGSGSVPQTSSAENIERGGTITDMNPEKKTITVDGAAYPVAAATKVYAADVAASGHSLTKGMMIRFTTVKDRVSGQEKIIGIWVTNSGNKPSQK